LLSQYEQLRVKEAVQANLISWVNPAAFPDAPSKPNKTLYLGLGLVISMIAGFGLVLVFENLDTTLFSSEQVTAVVRLPMLGRIPLERKKKGLQGPLNGSSYNTEAFLRLRTTFIQNVDESSTKSVMVTSALQGEGKSTIVCSLAYLLSQSTKKIILVDGDLRLSTVHKIFNLPNELGLCDYLLARAEVADIIQPTNFPGLSVITGGRSTQEPVNLLSSDRMKTLVLELQKNYDLVLFDSPAVLAVTDASVIAPLMDGVLLVVKRGFIGKEKLEATIEQLTNVKAKLMGFAINGEDISENYYEYQAYSSKKK
jgi:polysaccharide biosynthesis transport protein